MKDDRQGLAVFLVGIIACGGAYGVFYALQQVCIHTGEGVEPLGEDDLVIRRRDLAPMGSRRLAALGIELGGGRQGR